LKLENLRIDGRIEPGDLHEIFTPLLATLFKNSIQSLVVSNIQCPSFIQLPYMPKLETLHLFPSNNFHSKYVSLNKLFPALKNFYFIVFGIQREWEELLPDSDPCPNVLALYLGISFRIQLFDHILNIFPKLTKLHLQVKSDGVQILWKVMTEMKQLEYLRVYGEIKGIENIDALYTGFPVRKVHKLQHVVNELKKMTVHLRAETIRRYTIRYSHFPSIANLTNLKCLELHTTGTNEERTRYTRMTDVFLYFGLHSMKHINKLRITRCEFTKTASELLTTEMELETWSFTDSKYRDIIPPVECRYKNEWMHY